MGTLGNFDRPIKRLAFVATREAHTWNFIPPTHGSLEWTAGAREKASLAAYIAPLLGGAYCFGR
jgi:hypothetical protein